MRRREEGRRRAKEGEEKGERYAIARTCSIVQMDKQERYVQKMSSHKQAALHPGVHNPDLS